MCFIGRSADGEKPQEKLVLTERACEDICRAIDLVDPETVHAKSKDILKTIQKSNVLLQTLEQGIIVGSANSEKFVEFKSNDGAVQGLIARNRKQIETLILSSKDLQSSGLVLIAHDGPSEEPEPAEGEKVAVEQPIVVPSQPAG